MLALRILPASSKDCRGVNKRAGGPQGSAAGGGVKRPKRLGRHLYLRKQRAAQMLSVNPDVLAALVAFFYIRKETSFR